MPWLAWSAPQLALVGSSVGPDRPRCWLWSAPRLTLTGLLTAPVPTFRSRGFLSPGDKYEKHLPPVDNQKRLSGPAGMLPQSGRKPDAPDGGRFGRFVAAWAEPMRALGAQARELSTERCERSRWCIR